MQTEFALLHSSVLCIKGSRSSKSQLINESLIDLQVSEGYMLITNLRDNDHHHYYSVNPLF